MGVLRQASCTTADSNKITLSMWCQVPYPVVGFVPLLEFGTDGFSGVYLSYDTEGGVVPSLPQLQVGLTGTPDALDVGANIVGDDHNTPSQLNVEYDIPTDPPEHIDAGSRNWIYGAGSSWTSGLNTLAFGNSARVLGAAAAGMFDFGKWFHVLFSGDMSIASTAGADGAFTCPKTMLLINGVNQTTISGFGLSPFAVVEGTGNNWAFAYPNDALIAGHGDVHVGPEYFAGVDGDDPYGPIAIQIPNFNFELQGTTIGLPGSVDDGPIVRYADVQVWIGQAVNVLSNLNKFVTVSGGHGTPTPTSVATAAFGPQTFLFKGNKAAFPINQGTGGVFVKTGTINDTTPGPSY